MKDFEAIKELWCGQAQKKMNAEEAMQQIRVINQYYVKKLLMQSIFVGGSLLVLLTIGLFGHFHTWTTYIALFVLSLCLLYYLLLQIKDYKSLSLSVYHQLTPSEFIRYLKAYQHKSQLLNYTNFRIYLGGVSLAFILLLIELYFILPLWLIAFVFAGTAIWFGLAWFMIMKRYIKHKNEHFESMIKRLQRIEKQFD